MKRFTILFTLLLVFPLCIRSQENTTSDNAASKSPTERQPPIAAGRTSAFSLIETPKPKINVDEASACPERAGKPCALIGGRRYYPDAWGLAHHNRNWREAMLTPVMLIGAGLLIASTVADDETTNSCITAHTCSEGNPFFGKNPSRALMYGVSIPINAGVIFFYAKEKRHGRGFPGFISMWCLTMLHTSAAAHNASTC
ncbi:MAG: hypothetical protein WCE52_07720 [Candidatus Acidiferrum sp.]